MAALLPLLMSTALTDSSGLFYTDLLIHELLVILVGLSLLVGIILVRDLYDPLWFAHKNLRLPTIDIDSIVDDFHGLCNRLKVSVEPKAVVTDVTEPFSYGVYQGNSIIVLSTNFLSLGPQERRAVIAHELWHVHTDVESWYYQKIRKRLWQGLSLVALSAIVIAIFEHDYLGWWNNQYASNGQGLSSPMLDPYTTNLPWLFTLALLYPLIFFLLSRNLIVLFGYPAFLKRDHREYIADSVASIIVGPRAVAQAVEELISGERDIRRGARSWKDIYESEFTGGQHIPFGYRIAALFLMENFLNGSVKLSWKHDPRKLFERLLIGFVFHTRVILLGNMFAINRRVFWAIVDYMFAHEQKFNMVHCASETQSTSLQVYLTWFLLCVCAERLQVVEPKYDCERFLDAMVRV